MASRRGDASGTPARRPATSPPPNEPGAKRTSVTPSMSSHDRRALRKGRPDMIDPFTGQTGSATNGAAMIAGVRPAAMAATPADTPPSPAATPASDPTSRTKLSKKDADDILAIKADYVALRERIPENLPSEFKQLQEDFRAFRIATEKKLDDINEEFNEIAAEREVEQKKFLKVKEEFEQHKQTCEGGIGEGIEPDARTTALSADNLLKETVHKTMNQSMGRLSARSKLPPSVLDDKGRPIFWVMEGEIRKLRPWWEGDWADQEPWVSEITNNILNRGSVFNPSHEAEDLKKIPPKVISDAVQTAWIWWRRSINMATKPPEVQKAMVSKNTQNSRKQTKAEKRENALTEGLKSKRFTPEFAKQNRFLCTAPYASSENTECESDGEDPNAKEPIIDASSPPQVMDGAQADPSKKSKASRTLVIHPPDYRTDDVNVDLERIDAEVDRSGEKRARRRGKPRKKDELPKVKGPKGRPHDKILIPLNKVKEEWFAEGDRRKKFRTDKFVDMAGNIGDQAEGGNANTSGSGSGDGDGDGNTDGGVGGQRGANSDGEDDELDEDHE